MNIIITDAKRKKQISRTKGIGCISHLETSPTAPMTAVVMNTPAPRSSPNAIGKLFLLIPAIVEKTSGAPFPNASRVSPFWLFSKWLIYSNVRRHTKELGNSRQGRTKKFFCGGSQKVKHAEKRKDLNLSL